MFSIVMHKVSLIDITDYHGYRDLCMDIYGSKIRSELMILFILKYIQWVYCKILSSHTYQDTYAHIHMKAGEKEKVSLKER